MLSGVAVDAVFDSVSVATTFKEDLKKEGVIFCSFSEAVKKYPDFVKKYLGSVVPRTDNYYATLNSAVFTMVHLCISQKVLNVQWSYPPIFESMEARYRAI